MSFNSSTIGQILLLLSFYGQIVKLQIRLRGFAGCIFMWVLVWRNHPSNDRGGPDTLIPLLFHQLGHTSAIVTADYRRELLANAFMECTNSTLPSFKPKKNDFTQHDDKCRQYLLTVHQSHYQHLRIISVRPSQPWYQCYRPRRHHHYHLLLLLHHHHHLI